MNTAENINLEDIFGNAGAATAVNLPTTSTADKATVNLLLPGVYHDIPAADYHRLPYISSSFLKKFKGNPAGALLPVNQTPAMVLGSASHAYSLEGEAAFLKEYAVAPEIPCPATRNVKGWKNTNEYKEQIEAFMSANTSRIILTREQYTDILGIHASLQSHPLASTLLRQGCQELTLIWDDPETGLRCKARIDHNPGRNVLVDYKTCADSDRFPNQIINLNYDIQGAHYSMGAEANGIESDTFIFVAAETSEPYPVRCGFIHPEWMEWAKGETRRLLALVKECKERGLYPNYEIPGHICSLDQITPSDLLEEWAMPKWR